MNISIFGLGYVGCVSLGCLAQNGHRIVGIDVNSHKVNLINKGKPTIIEKGIDVIIREQFDKSRISATTDFRKAIMEETLINKNNLSKYIKLLKDKGLLYLNGTEGYEVTPIFMPKQTGDYIELLFILDLS